MPAKFVDAYNKNTGQKLEHPVPEQFFDLFPDTLARTPRAAAHEAKTAEKKEGK